MKPIHEIDETFFEKIDSEAKAYWLGFLVADGGVYRNHIRISLELTDKEHVLKFRKALKANSVPVFERTFQNVWNTKPQLCFDVTRKKLAQDLAKLGVVPRKTTEGWIPQLDPSVERHFWRGVFDGDGYISKMADGSWGVGICGNATTVEAFRMFLQKSNRFDKDFTVHAIKRRDRNLPPVCFRIVSQGRQRPGALLSLLYSDASPECALDRKFAKAQELLKEI